jgi:hypothetical protein
MPCPALLPTALPPFLGNYAPFRRKPAKN